MEVELKLKRIEERVFICLRRRKGGFAFDLLKMSLAGS